MFPFWEVAVAPVLEAAEAHRLVEIGALRGETTRLMIDRLGPRTELHVIDPLPDFDPAEHEREFGGQYTFHRDLSLNVLDQLPPMDAALIDGDHNWYTVSNELRLLREVARSHDAPLPLLLLHDVGWPYGRRDLYYDPETIPDEHLRDWKRAGMEPGKVRLVPFGAGLNPTLANAKVEGGRHNGVMTALDDFVAEHDRPVRVVVLPVYFGLAIVAEVERLDRQPALAAELDRLESPAGKDQLLELAEDIRLRALMFQHRIFFDREATAARLARRYLGQVKDGPVGGSAGATSLDHLESCLDTVREDHVIGDVAALGPEPPGVALLLAAYLEAYDLSSRHLWAVSGEPSDGMLGPVRAGLERLDLPPDRTHVVDASSPPGPPAAEWPERLALLHLGAGSGAATEPLLGDLLGRLAEGGYVLVDAEAGSAAVAAVVGASPRLGLVDAGVPSGATGSCWRRTGGAVPSGAGVDPSVDRAQGF